MKKFKVIKSGVTSDDCHWFLISNPDKDGFVASAIVKNTKDISKNGNIEIPKAVADEINWRY